MQQNTIACHPCYSEVFRSNLAVAEFMDKIPSSAKWWHLCPHGPLLIRVYLKVKQIFQDNPGNLLGCACLFNSTIKTHNEYLENK